MQTISRETPASRPRYIPRERDTAFGSRKYTRHVIYPDEDDDIDPDAFDLNAHAIVREGSDASAFYENPFSEARMTEMVEQPENVVQFRDDIHGHVFHEIVGRRPVIESANRAAPQRTNVDSTAERQTTFA